MAPIRPGNLGPRVGALIIVGGNLVVWFKERQSNRRRPWTLYPQCETFSHFTEAAVVGLIARAPELARTKRDATLSGDSSCITPPLPGTSRPLSSGPRHRRTPRIAPAPIGPTPRVRP